MLRRRPTLRVFQRYASPAARGALFLVAVDAITNVIDYGFHIFLGRALPPADFAVIQALNSLILIILTTFGVLQPVVARFVAESAAGGGQVGRIPAGVIFQAAFRLAAALGLVVLAAAWLGRDALATWLAIPRPALALALLILPLALLRPVVAGYLQGRERVIAFGLVRAAHAAGRFGAALLFVAGAGLIGAVAAFPAGAAIALAVGVAFSGRAAWAAGPALPRRYLREGAQLAAGALFAYAAYMSLLNNDLIWVNRAFAPTVAADYAVAVLFRRVLALAPGALLVLFYPRVVARVAQGRLPDGLLLKSAAVITLPTLILLALYFSFGSDIVQFAFGANYHPPNWLLGWLGVGMLGYIFVSLWMNLFLAIRPLAFVLMLVAGAIGQALLYARFDAGPRQTVAVFAGGGWMLALGGLALYLMSLRPSLRNARNPD